MADIAKCPPLTRESVQTAHERIKAFIHRTPVVSCETINHIASTAQAERDPKVGPQHDSQESSEQDASGHTARPKIKLFFKCENQQRIGAFKARGAFHALGRLIEEQGVEQVRKTGVVTHSSGNHAQALALAAKSHAIPAHIVMPTISTPSKIAGTQSHGANVIFSGSTSDEREAVVADVIKQTGATLVPPYDHPDIMLGQGTLALEMEQQVKELIASSPYLGRSGSDGLDAVIAPIGGGGMLSGVCIALHGTGIRVFGAEPSFQGANDAEMGLKQGKRVERNNVVYTPTPLRPDSSTEKTPATFVNHLTPRQVTTDASGHTARPKIKLFFKCENQQRIGAFKARGAFHALGRLIEEQGVEQVRKTGVVTHSSGNHAQALALAAKSHAIPAHIVMPTISTPSKIAGTQSHGANVIFSGSTSDEREAVVADVIKQTGATLVPPYDHPDIMLGQGTLALEMEQQVKELIASSPYLGRSGSDGLDAVIAPIGGGGMLSGVCIALHGTGIRVFGAEPSFQGANDAEMGLKQGKRVEKVKSLTIADGVRTPVGHIPWTVVSDRSRLAGVFSVTEEQITAAMRLLMERAKLFIEPTAAVPLAVVLYNEEFRRMVQRESGEQGWNVGVVLSGGNTTMEAIAKLFSKPEPTQARAEGTLTMDGKKVAENVAG
nr:putative serine racemase [Quercus suber]